MKTEVINSQDEHQETWTNEHVIHHIKQENVLFIRLQFIDILGMPKNIVVPASRIEEALEDGIPFDASSIDGYATIEESDKIAKPCPSSFVVLPESIEKRKTAKLNCDIYEPNGDRFLGDTKYVLERAVTQAREQGYLFNVGPECEFFLFKKNGDQTSLKPNDSAGYFDLSHRDLAEGVRAEISLALDNFGITTYTSHHEVSAGQHEINFRYADAVTTADRVITLKYVTKVIATTHGLHASFMPKPIYGLNGSGMHTHLSLFDRRDANAFFDRDSPHQLSQTARYFIGGIIHYIKELTGILNPTVNSYKRLVPGYEAPTYISWANNNRSALIRIPSKRGNSTRCELRSPDLSGNPYLQFAVILTAGLQGLKERLEPPEAVEKNIYELTAHQRLDHGIGQLPESLGHALDFMEKSDLMKQTLGDHVFEHFLYVKHQEWNAYRTQVTNWELERYLPAL
ncbi:MAG: type I glutamate--ammonia ligase [Candidatus Thermoplasmatota archaeon]|nr:type I glutamate--ammonia ligase [Candidatus Thermoplasmatota archaeon]